MRSEHTAVVTQIGAGVRALRHGDGTPTRDLILSYPANTVRPYYRGAVLAAWPNRVANGCYRVRNETQ